MLKILWPNLHSDNFIRINFILSSSKIYAIGREMSFKKYWKKHCPWLRTRTNIGLWPLAVSLLKFYTTGICLLMRVTKHDLKLKCVVLKDIICLLLVKYFQTIHEIITKVCPHNLFATSRKCLSLSNFARGPWVPKLQCIVKIVCHDQFCRVQSVFCLRTAF